MTLPASAARVLRVDAALDSALAVLLLVTAFVPSSGAWARPSWLSAVVLSVGAFVLVALAVVLLVLAREPTAGALRVLGFGNGISGLVLGGWVEVDSSLGSGLNTALLLGAVGLAIVGAVQIRIAQSVPSRPPRAPRPPHAPE